MPLHVRKLHAYLPAAMQRDTAHRIQSQRAPHALALLCKLEAARLKKQADALRDTERRRRATEIRDALSDKKRGLGRAFAKLRNGGARPIGFLADPA